MGGGGSIRLRKGSVVGVERVVYARMDGWLYQGVTEVYSRQARCLLGIYCFCFSELGGLLGI